MPEQTFRSPNFYQREIDLSAPTPTGPTGTPAGVIGTANRGPAFVPVTFGNFSQFVSTFGNLDPNRFGPYAVNQFLVNRSALTFLRVLGAGANATTGDISRTLQTGRVVSAGTILTGTVVNESLKRTSGGVQFLTARHTLQANEAYGIPLFTDNDSFSGGTVNLVRGVILTPTGSRIMLLDGNASAVGVFNGTNFDTGSVSGNVFKLAISSTLGNAFWNTDGNAGVKILTASLNPTDANYFAKILNTDPDKFVSAQHLVYADFPVDNELATATVTAIVSGSSLVSPNSGDSSLSFRQSYGAWDTRYAAPQTPNFISQPFGATEYDLFKFEAIDDGAYANTLYKIAIADLKASLDDSNQYGTFTVQVRDWNDTDVNPLILESFPNCSLNPHAANYVARLIGDRKVSYNFDATISSERRVVVSGKYPNVSSRVRVLMTDAVDRGLVPAKSLPFGFRGLQLLKTNDALTDTAPSAALSRLWGNLAGGGGPSAPSSMSGSILPPIPFRVKVTRGDTVAPTQWVGQPGPTEQSLSLYYWGVKFERNTLPLDPNLSSEPNMLLSNYTKFMGISKLDVLLTGSGADTMNNNKFTLAKVAFSNGALTDLTSSVANHMREAAYIRNAKLDLSNYTFKDPVLGTRITLGTVVAQASASVFNQFTQFTKFATFMAGGWDGTNILDRDARRMNDKAASFDLNGGASVGYVAPGLGMNPAGTGQSNSTVSAYQTAVNIMTDPLVVNTNILMIPGIRESYITDYACGKVRDYGLAYFVMDIPSYDDSTNRLYDDSTARPSIDVTAAQFDSRGIDNNYAGTYFPDVYIDDATNRRRVKVPASIAAMGALGFNDRVSYPWFAPAGFNRASLDFVANVAVRLNVTDRDRLYDSRINPIATFPRLGFVIYGQKTLQVKKSALDRVNVRRLLLEVKRIIIGISQKMVFEQNTPDVRNKFVADATLQLGMIQVQAGVEAFQVVMNESNNTQQDVDLLRLNGKVIIIPTRTIEFIAIDFVITNTGLSFQLRHSVSLINTYIHAAMACVRGLDS